MASWPDAEIVPRGADDANVPALCVSFGHANRLRAGVAMMSFRSGRLDAMPIAPAAVWLIGDIMEAKGRQDLYARQAPDVLKALRDLAMVQSVESSNRIEGVTVAPARLRPLVLGKAKPQDRSEEEVRGYREALDWIHRESSRVPITPATIRRLHALCQAGAADAGAWKRVNNDHRTWRGPCLGGGRGLCVRLPVYSPVPRWQRPGVTTADHSSSVSARVRRGALRQP
jgi:hypothetical protein